MDRIVLKPDRVKSTLGSPLCRGPTFGAKLLQLPATLKLLPATGRSLAEGTGTAVRGLVGNLISAQIGKAFGQFPAGVFGASSYKPPGHLT